MSEFFPCPWCGSQPGEYSKWDDDGFTYKRFGCKNPECPVKPFIDITLADAKTGIERWQKMEAIRKLQSALADCERDKDTETKRGWPFVDPKAP